MIVVSPLLQLGKTVVILGGCGKSEIIIPAHDCEVCWAVGVRARIVLAL